MEECGMFNSQFGKLLTYHGTEYYKEQLPMFSNMSYSQVRSDVMEIIKNGSIKRA